MTNKMKSTHYLRYFAAKKLVPLAVATFILGGCSSAEKPYAGVTEPAAVRTSALDSNSNYTPGRDRIRRHFYVGAGTGLSRLDPDASQSSTFDVNDRVQNTALLNAGVDLSRQWSLDFQAVNLGSAGFSPNGTIEYREFNGSALFYVGKSRHRFKRRGFTGFGRIGAGYLDNTTNGVPFDQVNGLHLLLGVGAEYMTGIGLGVRAEAISYDEDIILGQLGLIYRFGRQQRREPVQTVAAPLPEPTPVVEPAPIVAAALPEPNACLELSGVAEGVNFRTNSADLTDESRDVLTQFATAFEDCKNSSITVSAHTDDRGAKAYNQKLSQQRADSVVTFFEESGIDSNRLESTAFGESTPLDTNDTREGRARNRRVELHINDIQ